MANNQIKFGIGFNVDKTGLNQIRTELQQIANMTQGDFLKLNTGGTTNDLLAAKRAAGELEQALNRAFNKDLGTLNVSKFNNEIKSSGKTINQLYNDLAKIGPKGTSAFRDLATQVLTTNKQLKKTHNVLDSMAKTMSNTIKWGIASSAMNNFTGSVRKAYGYVKELDTSLNDIRIVTGKSAEEMDSFAKRANDAAKELATKTTDYTEAALIYYQQGLADKEVAVRAETTLKAANVTGQTGQEVSEQLTAVWNGYKVSAQETELYVDKLAAVAATTASDLEELSTGMSKVASAANAMGVDIDQLNGHLSTVISVTRQAPESVGTAFKTIYARLGDLAVDGQDEFGTSLGEVSGKLKTMGIDILDSQGQMRDMGTVMEEVAEKWNTWTDAQQQAAAVAMAGKRQYNNLIALFENWDMYEDAVETSANAMGTLQNQQDIYMESAEAHLDIMKASFEDMYDSLLDEDTIKTFADGITLAVNGVTNLIDSIGGGGNALLALGSIATRVFSKHLAQSLSITIQNFKNMKFNAQQVAAELELVKNISMIPKADASIQQIAMMKESVLGLKNILTEEQEVAANALIKQTNEAYSARDAYNQLKASAEAFLNSQKMGGKGTIAIDSLNDDDKMNMQYQLGEKQKAFKEDIQLTNEWKDSIDKALKSYQDSIGRFKDSKGAIEELKKAKVDLKGVQDRLKQSLGKESEEYLKVKAAMDKYNIALKEGNAAAAKKAFNEVTLVLNQQNQKLISNAEQTKQALQQSLDGIGEKVKREVQEADAAWKSFISEVNRTSKIQFVINTVGAFGQMASALQSVINLTDVWNNQDLSFGKKMLQTITSLGFALPMLATSFTQVGGALGITTALMESYTGALIKGTVAEKLANGIKMDGVAAITANNAARILEMGTEEAQAAVTSGLIALRAGEITQKEFDTIVTNALTTANMGLTASLGAAATAMKSFLLTNPIGWAILAATAIAGVVAVVDMLSVSAAESKENLEDSIKAYEDIENELKSLQGELDTTKQKIEELEAKGTLSLVESEELNNLRTQNALLETEIELEQQLLDIEKEKKKYAFKDAVDQGGITVPTMSGYDPNQVVTPTSDIQNSIGQESFRYFGSGDYQKKIDISRDGSIQGYNTTVGNLQDTRQYYLNESEKAYKDGDEKLGKKLEKIADRVKTYLEDYQQDYNEKKSDIISQTAETYKQGASVYGSLDKEQDAEYIKVLNNNAKTMFEAMGTWTEKVATTISQGNISKEDLDQIKNTDLIGEDGSYDYDQITGKNGIFTKEEFEAIEEYADAMQISVQDVFETLKNDGTLTFEEIQNKAKEAFGGMEDVRESIGSLGQKASEGSLTRENIASDEDYQAVKTGLSMMSEEDYKEIAKEAEAFYNQNLVGTEAWSEALGVIQNKLNELSLEELGEDFKDAYDEIDTLGNGIEFGVDLNIEEEDFNDQMDALLNADYSISVEIHAQAEDAFNQVTGAIENIRTQARNIGEDFVVAAEDVRELNNAFPGILENCTNLHNGTVQLNQESVELAMNAANAEVAADVEATNVKLENDAAELEAKGKIYQGMAEAASALAQSEKLDSTSVATHKQTITNGLAELKELATTDEKEKDAEVATNAQENAGILASNWAEAYKSAAESAAQFAQDAVEAAQVAASGKGSVSIGDYGANYSGTAGVTQEGSEIGNYTQQFEEAEDSSDYEALAESFRQAAETNFDLANDIRGMQVEAASILSGAVDDFSNVADGLGPDPDTSGSDKDPEQLDKVTLEDLDLDPYRRVNSELERIANNLEQLSNEQDRLYGDRLLKNLQKQSKELKKQVYWTQKKLKIANDEKDKLYKKNKNGKDTGVLAEAGIKVDEHGDITNADSVLKAKRKDVNKDITKYNNMTADEQESEAGKALKKQIENKQAAIEALKENIDDYEELINSTIPDLESDIQEAAYQQIEIEIQKFKVEGQLYLDMSEALEQLKDFKQKMNEYLTYDELDIRYTDDGTDLALGGGSLLSEASISEKNVNANIDMLLGKKNKDGTRTGLGLMGTIGDGTDSPVSVLTGELKGLQSEYEKYRQDPDSYRGKFAKEGEDGKWYFDEAGFREAMQETSANLEEEIAKVEEAYKENREALLNSIDLIGESYAQQMETYDFINDRIESQIEAAKLLNGETDYAGMQGYYEQASANAQAKADTAKEEMDLAYEKMNDESLSAEEREKWQKIYQDAVGEYEDASFAAIEAYKAENENYVRAQADAAFGTDAELDLADAQWDVQTKLDDKYLDDIDKAYEVQKLSRKLQQDMDGASLAAQQKLAKFRDEELEKLKEKDKLTQYDVDRANKLYEIELKKIALEEAQQNKSKMRLRRDSSGNYSYQFVADEDQTAEAQQGLEDAQYGLREMDLEHQRELQEDMLEMQKEYKEKWIEYNLLSEEEQKLREDEYKIYFEYYQGELTSMAAQALETQDNLKNSSFETAKTLYSQDKTNFKDLTDAQKLALEDKNKRFNELTTAEKNAITGEGGLMPTWNAAILDMAAKFGGEGEDTFESKIKKAQGNVTIKQDELNGKITAAATGIQTAAQTAQTQANTKWLPAQKKVNTQLKTMNTRLSNANKYLKKQKEWWNKIKNEAQKAIEKTQTYLALTSKEEAGKTGGKNTGGKNNTGGNTGGSTDGKGTQGNGKVNKGDKVKLIGKLAESSYESPTLEPLSKYKGAQLYVQAINSGSKAPYHLGTSKDFDDENTWVGWVNKAQISGYDTGGYTGSGWAPQDKNQGKLAFLHEKELILNSTDTQNILDLVYLLRKMNIEKATIGGAGVQNAMSANALEYSNRMIGALVTGIDNIVKTISLAKQDNQKLEQNVHITAEFPDVKEAEEIKLALNNLTNRASQYIGNSRRR